MNDSYEWIARTIDAANICIYVNVDESVDIQIKQSVMHALVTQQLPH